MHVDIQTNLGVGGRGRPKNRPMKNEQAQWSHNVDELFGKGWENGGVEWSDRNTPCCNILLQIPLVIILLSLLRNPVLTQLFDGMHPLLCVVKLALVKLQIDWEPGSGETALRLRQQ